MRWLGVDPGWRWTAVVVRHGGELLSHQVIDREAVDPGSDSVTEAYLDAVAEVIDRCGEAIPPPRRAMENVVSPVGYEFVKPAHLIGLGIAIGGLRHRYPGILLVQPGKHGRRPLATYPALLVTDAERRHAARNGTWGRDAPQNSVLRHARSAWDVAGAAPAVARIQAALGADQSRRRS